MMKRYGRSFLIVAMQSLMIQVTSLKERIEDIWILRQLLKHWVFITGWFTFLRMVTLLLIFLIMNIVILLDIQKHSTETKSSTSLPTISGTVTEIGNGYIMVDDTILCRKSKAGKKYKVYTDDIKVRRWIESGEVKAGDLVAVEYEGEISNDYEVKGAYSIFTGTLEENGILNQE